MTDRLSLYNNALTRHLGERRLGSLTEERGPRRQLDEIWDAGFVDDCLEQGLWNFAMRSMKVEFSESIEPPFGYQRAFDHPDDMIRIASVCEDEYYWTPLLKYQDEGAFWFCDLDAIFIRFVSNGADYGNDLANWPLSFTRWAEGYMATQAVEIVTKSKTNLEKLEKKVNKLLITARGRDAMKDPTRFTPEGTFVQSRRSHRRYRRSTFVSN